MTMNQSIRIVMAIATIQVAALSMIKNETQAGKHKLLDQTGCSLCCPACNHRCNFSAEQVDEEKSCFEVEAKVICIPRVVFPWQKECCDSVTHNGARTRKVCVLKEKKYKCPACEYTWTAERIGGCSTGCATGCDVNSHHYTTPSASTGVPQYEYHQQSAPIHQQEVTPGNLPYEPAGELQAPEPVEREFLPSPAEAVRVIKAPFETLKNVIARK